jgi:D-alanyl-D-alanine carboxypeptidase
MANLKKLFCTVLLLAGLSTQASPWLDADIEAMRVEGKIPGLQIAAIRDNKIYSSKYGMSSPGKDWRTTDLLRIASVSKTFIAALFFKMSQNGKIELEDTLDQYLDSKLLPDVDFKKVTMAHLLQHSSGIPD